MYKITGDVQIVLTLWYRGSVGTLMIYPIIIADIAPRIPGSLTHFNWPRLLCYKLYYRVYLQNPTEGFVCTRMCRRFPMFA